MAYITAEPISLRTHPELNEKWLQQAIADNPSILGLGDLELRAIEKRQPRAGRLDVLLSDPESLTRYEVEIQLGPTDESHIIRTIEYWDIERARYPQYDHVAVIVAEDITSRFLNVINLFNRSIPLIAIQMSALKVGDAFTLHATKILDLVTYGTEEEDDAGQTTDRAYWETRASPDTVKLADLALELVKADDPGVELKYNKYYIGLARNGAPDNYVIFKPRKRHLGAFFRLAQDSAITDEIEQQGIDLMPYDNGRYRLQLYPRDFADNNDLLRKLVKLAKQENTQGPSD